MTLTLETNAAELIREGIEANRAEAADLVPRVLEGDIEAGERMNQLNEAWYDLGSALHTLTGEDPAPYRMKFK